MSEEKMATGLESIMTWLNKKLKADQNFDVVYRVTMWAGKMPALLPRRLLQG